MATYCFDAASAGRNLRLPQRNSNSFRSVVTLRPSAVNLAVKRSRVRARMANKILGAQPVTVPTRVPKQRSFALVADKLPPFLLSRVEIGLFIVRAATSRSRVDGVVAAAEEIVAGIIAATDLLLTIQCYFEVALVSNLSRMCVHRKTFDQSLLLAGCGR